MAKYIKIVRFDLPEIAGAERELETLVNNDWVIVAAGGAGGGGSIRNYGFVVLQKEDGSGQRSRLRTDFELQL